MQLLHAPSRLSFGIIFNSPFPRLLTLRCSRLIILSLLTIASALMLADRASAQSACEQLGVDCTPHGETRLGRPTESDEERDERRAAAAEARAERRAAKDAKNAIKRKAKEETRRQIQQRAEERRQQELNAARDLEKDKLEQAAAAEHKRQAAVDAQLKLDAFNKAKSGVASGLKDVGNAPVSSSRGSLGLKEIDEGSRDSAKAAWIASITDPQVRPIARHLASVVPPMPIPESEVDLDLKKIYINDNRLLKTTDYVVAGWQMAGLIGEASVGVTVLMIAGKTLIAGQDGAYLYLAKEDKLFDAASAYLKNPEQAQTFAHLVQDVREHRSLPASADPAMVAAARAITEPRAGSGTEGVMGNVGIMWDMMTSPDALSAMIRKASVESISAFASYGAGKLIKGSFASQEERKAVFDSVRQDRAQARRMIELPTTSNEQRAELKALIQKADQTTADIYRIDKGTKRVKDGVAGIAISDATDKIAEILLGPGTPVHEF